jgi:FkbM family methyltransferase
MSLKFLPFKHSKDEEAYTVDKECQVENLPAIYEEVFGRRNVGVFVEVGAMDGQSHSNTCGLADIGWGGLYIEATKKYALACYERHKNNKKVQVVRRAISDHEGTLRFHLANALTTADSLSQDAYAAMDWSKPSLSHTYEEVPCTTLNKTLQEFGIPAGFDLLVIDVEGHEQEVLNGVTLTEWKPKMIIIEIQDEHPDFLKLPNADVFVTRCKALRTHIESCGYVLRYKNTINSVYVRAK